MVPVRAVPILEQAGVLYFAYTRMVTETLIRNNYSGTGSARSRTIIGDVRPVLDWVCRLRRVRPQRKATVSRKGAESRVLELPTASERENEG